MRALIGGIGYRYLRDGAIGPWVTDQLAERATSEVEVEDVGYHPVGFSQNLQDREPYDRVVLVGSYGRGREAGSVHSYRWDRLLPDNGEIQNRVSEAVTGVISLDNLLIVVGALGGFPEDVRVVEVEPVDEGWGEGFSPAIDAKLDQIKETVWSLTRP